MFCWYCREEEQKDYPAPERVIPIKDLNLNNSSDLTKINSVIESEVNKDDFSKKGDAPSPRIWEGTTEEDLKKNLLALLDNTNNT